MKAILLIFVALFALSLQQTTGQNDVECFVCQGIIFFGEDFAAKNPNQQALEQFIQNQVCSKFPKTYLASCNNFVQANYQSIINDVTSNASPFASCNQLNASNQNSRVIFQHKPAKEEDPVVCSICTLVINLAESILGRNATESAIEDFLENTVCSILPFGLSKDCDSFVVQYLPALVQYIQSGQNGTVACTELGVCPGAVAPVHPQPIKPVPMSPLMKLTPVKPVEQQVGGPIECLICTSVINLAETVLGSNASESVIEDFLDHTVCGLLPNTLGQDCDLLVATYLPALVQYIKTGQNGTHACTEIGICPGASVRPLMKLIPVKPAVQLAEPKEADPVVCTICTLVINLAESVLGSNATESAIEDFLENTVCSILPFGLSKDCDSFVVQYLPALVQYIQSGQNGTVACTELGVCPGASVMQFKPIDIIPVKL